MKTLVNISYPAGFIEDFVYKYRNIIEPALESGKIEGIAEIILDIASRFASIDSSANLFGMEQKIYNSYFMAVLWLKSIPSKSDKKTMELFRGLINTQVSNLEYLMQGNKDYEKARKG